MPLENTHVPTAWQTLIRTTTLYLACSRLIRTALFMEKEINKHFAQKEITAERACFVPWRWEQHQSLLCGTTSPWHRRQSPTSLSQALQIAEHSSVTWKMLNKGGVFFFIRWYFPPHFSPWFQNEHWDTVAFEKGYCYWEHVWWFLPMLISFFFSTVPEATPCACFYSRKKWRWSPPT